VMNGGPDIISEQTIYEDKVMLVVNAEAELAKIREALGTKQMRDILEGG